MAMFIRKIRALEFFFLNRSSGKKQQMTLCTTYVSCVGICVFCPYFLGYYYVKCLGRKEIQQYKNDNNG